MSESEPTQLRRMNGETELRGHSLHPPPYGTAALRLIASPPSQSSVVSFDRHELRRILDLYGRKVAEGEWRDYAIDFTRDRAVFSIFRRACEIPIYRIEKDPRLARRQGAYSVITPTGLILRRGHDLAKVIRVLDKPVKLVVS